MSIERLRELRALLRQADHEYHVLGAAQTLTDHAYDTHLRELVDLEKQHPAEADPNSPTSRVGGLVPGFEKVAHGRRMLSLDNVFNADETLAFFGEGAQVVLEPKIDGLSVSLTYEEGSLVRAVTRGDGAHGDDVTVNVRTIRSVPLQLAEPLDIEVRGEVYLTYTDFELLCARAVQQGDEPFANPRNAAAGSLRLKDSVEVAARRLSFVAHGTVTEFTDRPTHSSVIELFEALGFVSVRTLPQRAGATLVSAVGMVTVDAQLAKVIAKADTWRKTLDLPTDGLVFKLDDLAAQRELGEGTKSPKWAVAYKFPPERKATKIKDIILQVGRTGKITPVADLEPVELGGTTVSRVSLCNEEEITRIGCNVGDDVLVEKAAEIIPKVVGMHKRRSAQPYRLPDACPCCQQPLTRPEGFVDTYCLNAICPDQVFQQLAYATGKGALDIDGCGDVMVRHLMACGVRTLLDLFTVKDLGSMKTAARTKFVRGREAALQAPLWRKIAALGIEGIGKGKAQDLAARFPNLMEADEEGIQQVVGPAACANFFAFIDANGGMITALADLGFVLAEDAAKAGPLSGKVFVITGALLSGTRDEIIRKIEAAGGTVKGAVSAKVNFLVAGLDCGARKSADAKRLGVSVISEEELYQMMGVPMTVVESFGED